jgi:hypothetical protein
VAFVPEPEPEPAPPLVAAPPPVVKIHTPAALNVWARKETPAETSAASVDELNDLLARLGVPESVASVSYPQGVRIRRLRVIAAKESHSSLHGPAVLSRRMLAELRGTDPRVSRIYSLAPERAALLDAPCAERMRYSRQVPWPRTGSP